MPEKLRPLQRTEPVRISLPASVAYNVDALQKSIAEIVDRLGCTRCFSGADCVFELERDWLVNEKLELTPLTASPEPVPWRRSAVRKADGSAPIRAERRVALPAKVAYDLGDIQKVVAKVADKLGHAQCFSGFDIGFGLEEQLVINAKGQVAG